MTEPKAFALEKLPLSEKPWAALDDAWARLKLLSARPQDMTAWPVNMYPHVLVVEAGYTDFDGTNIDAMAVEQYRTRLESGEVLYGQRTSKFLNTYGGALQAIHLPSEVAVAHFTEEGKLVELVQKENAQDDDAMCRITRYPAAGPAHYTGKTVLAKNWQPGPDAPSIIDPEMMKGRVWGSLEIYLGHISGFASPYEPVELELETDEAELAVL